MLIDLVVGGLSGVISRTLTAPLELYKIQRQNAFIPNSTIRDVLKKGGDKIFMERKWYKLYESLSTNSN